MNFTPKLFLSSMAGRTLALALVGLVGWTGHAAPAPVAAQNIVAAQSFHASNPAPVIIAVQTAPAVSLPGATSYQPVAHWYKSKSWWKRNAPIVGGAGGGALVGGLIGGAPGAVIGGAAGGGGGYLYKRSRERHYYKHHYNNRYKTYYK